MKITPDRSPALRHGGWSYVAPHSDAECCCCEDTPDRSPALRSGVWNMHPTRHVNGSGWAGFNLKYVSGAAAAHGAAIIRLSFKLRGFTTNT